MKDQRWPGDSQTMKQEFQSARREEQMGMADVMASHSNDYIAKTGYGLDRYQTRELESSWSTQLDTVGMQPHAREYLEREASLK